MDYVYSHSYEDPDTGEVIEVMVPDDGDDDFEYRNARVIDNRSRSRGRRRPPRPPRPQPRPHRPVPAPRPVPVIARPRPTQMQDGEYFTVKKSAVAEVIPAVGMVWASFLGTPTAPKATGDDITDRDNATAHREALAQHQQNQTRILALTELAGRAFNLLAN